MDGSRERRWKRRASGERSTGQNRDQASLACHPGRYVLPFQSFALPLAALFGSDVLVLLVLVLGPEPDPDPEPEPEAEPKPEKGGKCASSVIKSGGMDVFAAW